MTFDRLANPPSAGRAPRGAAEKAAVRLMISAFFLSLLSGAAYADVCSTIIPGAQRGPMPGFRGWIWDKACYISWPGTDSRDYSRNPRLEYERQCLDTPGHLHFEGDFGSNHNTCIFEAPREESDPAPTKQPEPVRAAPAPEPPAEDKPSPAIVGKIPILPTKPDLGYLTAADCIRAGGMPDSTITSKLHPDPKRPCRQTVDAFQRTRRITRGTCPDGSPLGYNCPAR